MGIRIIGISLLVAFTITFVSVGLWNVSVPLAVLIGNPHSADTMGYVRYTFLGMFIGTYILSFCWLVYQVLKSERTE